MAGKNLAMRNQRMSVACISEPEFLNITSINPLISKAEVKVLYVGENRNKSYISKEVATKIAGTLPGCPIVGYYREDKEDFFDHGNVVTIDGDGVKFNDATRPYGFVAPNAKIWFQKFVDTDEDGNEVIHEYLMTEAFLWTGQYEECKRVVEDENGNPQSMKLHEETLDGTWSKLGMSNIDFFIINDAIIQNLCILGEDVEPCFEGADITRPKLSANFSHTDENVATLFTMMKELKDLLSQEEGGHSMLDETKTEFEAVVTETPVVEEEKIENFSNEQDKIDEVTPVENQVNTEEFKKQCEDGGEETPSNEEKIDETSDKTESKDSTSDNEDKKDENEDKKKKEFELLETEYAELKEKFASLEASYNELVEFKKNVEDKQKDELIASFYMLDEEDKKAVIEKKSEYSLDDIEKELSVICVRKKVNFNLEEEVEKEQSVATTFNLDSLETADTGLPAWLKAVQETSKSH